MCWRRRCSACATRPRRSIATAKPNATRLHELGGKPEITRFKGLGEISPKEFAQFIGKEMRLSKVEYAPRAESGPIFNFYMGKNTPERKDYIMDKLVVPVEARRQFALRSGHGTSLVALNGSLPCARGSKISRLPIALI